MESTCAGLGDGASSSIRKSHDDTVLEFVLYQVGVGLNVASGDEENRDDSTGGEGGADGGWGDFVRDVWGINDDESEAGSSGTEGDWEVVQSSQNGKRCTSGRRSSADGVRNVEVITWVGQITDDVESSLRNADESDGGVRIALEAGEERIDVSEEGVADKVVVLEEVHNVPSGLGWITWRNDNFNREIQAVGSGYENIGVSRVDREGQLLGKTARFVGGECVSPVLADSVSPRSRTISRNAFSRIDAPTALSHGSARRAAVDVSANIGARSSLDAKSGSGGELVCGEVGIGFLEVGGTDQELVDAG